MHGENKLTNNKCEITPLGWVLIYTNKWGQKTVICNDFSTTVTNKEQFNRIVYIFIALF